MEPQLKDVTPGVFTPLQQVTPLSKILAAVIFITLPFVAFFIGSQYGEYNTDTLNNASNLRSNVAVSRDSLENVREISPDMYIINNQMLFSPSRHLVVTGFLENVVFDGNNLSSCAGCEAAIAVLPTDNSATDTPAEYIRKLIKNEGGDPDLCTVEAVASSDMSNQEFVVYPSNEIAVTDQELFDSLPTLHPQTFASFNDYQTFCSDNPECSGDRDNVKAQKAAKLCSKYASAPFKRNYFLINTNWDNSIVYALFISDYEGPGDRPSFSSVRFVPQ